MSDKDIQNFLEHHGVKGMRWGVRKEEETSGRDSKITAQKPTTNKTKEQQEYENYSKGLEAKYGKDSLSGKSDSKNSDGHHLTSGQKKALIVGGVVVGVAAVGGAAYLYKTHQSGLLELAREQQSAAARLEQAKPENVLKELDRAIGRIGDTPNKGVAMHWNEGVSLSKGTVFQRMSTAKETDIRPNGFFACFDQSDVEHYKAGLPVWWKRWGYPQDSGYLTQLKAQTDIKAPSGKESVAIYKKLFVHMDTPENVVRGYERNGTAFSPEQRKQALSKVRKLQDLHAKAEFGEFSAHWANGFDNNPQVQQYFKEVKSRGYNSLIDFNDAGKLGKTPMRLLDGNDFKVSGHVPVSANDIAKAQKATKMNEFPGIVDFFPEGSFSHHDLTTEFLEHHGVKGMKWGVRRGKDGVRPLARTLNDSRFGRHSIRRAQKSTRSTRAGQKVGKFARDHKKGIERAAVVGAVGVGAAFLAKKGLKSMKLRQLPPVNHGTSLFIARNSKGEIISQFGSMLYPSNYPR